MYVARTSVQLHTHDTAHASAHAAIEWRGMAWPMILVVDLKLWPDFRSSKRAMTLGTFTEKVVLDAGHTVSRRRDVALRPGA